MKVLIQALRVKHWIKNLFIFLPMIFGKKFFDPSVELEVLAAFFLFSLASSAVYLINDILDLELDRLHPIKRNRPIASGKISRRQGALLACAIGIPAIMLSFLLNLSFGWTVFAYLVLNIIYSLFLKHAVIIDVFCLSAFFLLRIVAGGVVSEVRLSHWIIFMTLLLSLFLGFNKRRQELKMLQGDAASHRKVLAKYDHYFIDQMISIVTASIVIVYMLYTVDAHTIALIGSMNLIYSIPFVYYGIFRYLYLIHRIGNEGDPTRILFADRMIQYDLLAWISVCIFVIYFAK